MQWLLIKLLLLMNTVIKILQHILTRVLNFVDKYDTSNDSIVILLVNMPIEMYTPRAVVIDNNLPI